MKRTRAGAVAAASQHAANQPWSRLLYPHKLAMNNRLVRMSPAPNEVRRTAVPLSPADTRDIFEMYRSSPVLFLATDTFQQRLFSSAPEITLNHPALSDVALAPELMERLVVRYYLPWLRDLDLWCTLYGIAPYYYKYVKLFPNAGEAEEEADADESHVYNRDYTFVPIVPRMGSGQIETYLDERREQQFLWRWSNVPLSDRRRDHVDTSFAFVVDHAPTLDGRYTSAMSSLLARWRELESHKRIKEQFLLRQLNPINYVTFKPNIGAATGVKAATYVEGADRSIAYPFGEAGVRGGGQTAPLDMLQGIHRAQQDERGKMLSAEAYVPGALLGRPAQYTYDPRDIDREALQTLFMSHPDLQHVLRPQDALPPNTYTGLLPYEELHTLAPPSGQPDTQPLEERFDRMAAAVVNTPLDMIVNFGRSASTAGGGGGTDPASMRDFLTERLKGASRFYASMLEEMLRASLAPLLNDGRRKSKQAFHRKYGRPPTDREVAALEQLVDVHVEFPRTPDLNMDEMLKFYQYRLFTEEQIYKFAMDRVGLRAEEEVPAETKTALKNLFPTDKIEPAAAKPAAGGAATQKAKSKPSSGKK